MPLHLQSKLLRVLQEQEVERVGSTRSTKLDVRVISATNSKIEKDVERGHFREDLYYRLNVIPIVLPPMRERREDIALLARHFLQRICKEMKRPNMHFSAGAIFALEEYAWPGNVREMENVIERTVALTDGDTITPRDLPPNIGGAEQVVEPESHHGPILTEEGLDMPRTINEIEARLISEAMELTGGVKARAAALLGINRTTLVEKIKRLGLGA